MTTTDVKFPQVRVKLSGRDGNAYNLLGICTRAAREAGVPKADIDAFLREAMSGDYDHLLATACSWFTIR